MSFKRTAFVMAIAAGGCLATPVWGDLQGLSYEIMGTDLVTDVGESWTVRVYADLDAGNQLNAVAGNSGTTKVISSSHVFFHDTTFGGPTSKDINDALFVTFPNLEWDSYVSVGSLYSNGYPFADNHLNDVGIDWTTWEGGGTLSVNDGTWFVTPGAAQGYAQTHTPSGCTADPVEGVFIGQFTILGGLGSSVTFEALFQGREADGTTNWQTSDSITVVLTAPGADCNGNGVDDACDIKNGTSEDNNGDGVPDECADCNDNGTPDYEDIANGTSQDCNLNGIPDECDLANGASQDCDGNGVPDECQSNDCNTNGVPDSCDIANGTSQDCDANGTPDECQSDDCNSNGVPDSCDIADGTEEDCNANGVPDSCDIADGGDADGNGELDECEYTAYLNVDSGATYDNFADAIGGAMDGDRIHADFEAINAEMLTDFNGTDVRVTVINGDMAQPTGALLNLSNGGHLEAGTSPTFDGSVRSSGSGYSMVSASGLLSFNADLTVRTGADLELMAPTLQLVGNTTIRSGGGLDMSLTGSATNSGNMSAYGAAAMYASSLANSGSMTTSGYMFMDLLNTAPGTVLCNATTVLTGDLFNDGAVTVHVGTLYCLGDVVNNGSIDGDFNNGPGLDGSDPGVGDGMNVGGNYIAGADASLILPHANWMLSVGGNFDVAINDSGNYNMDLATLRMYAAGTGVDTLEAMSQDLGETLDGLDGGPQGNFPIGTLRIGGGDHVQVVDNHANTESGDEVLYVTLLIVEAGATFDGNGHTVWAGEIIDNGVILGDVDVIDPTPPCPGDYNGDGIVSVDDLLLVINFWGPDADAGDGDGDGDADVDDLLIVISNWGPCGS